MNTAMPCIEVLRAQSDPGTPTPGGSLHGDSLGRSIPRGCLQGSAWPTCSTAAPAPSNAQRSTSDAWEALQTLVSCLTKEVWSQPASPAVAAASPGGSGNSSGLVGSFDFRVTSSLEQPRSPVACTLPARSASLEGAVAAAKRKREEAGTAALEPQPKRVVRVASISSGGADSGSRQGTVAFPPRGRAPSPPTVQQPQPVLAVVPLLLAQRAWEREQQQQAAKVAMLLRSRSMPVCNSELRQALVAYSQLWSLKQLRALQQRGRGEQAPRAPAQLPDHIFQVFQKSLGQVFTPRLVATTGLL